MMPKILLSLPLLLAACATQAPAPQFTHTYGCQGSPTLIRALYDNSETDTNKVTLLLGDKTYTLTQVVAASGVRYSTSTSANPGAGQYVWWGKGTNATLYITEDSTTQPKYVYEKQLATCILSYQNPGQPE